MVERLALGLLRAHVEWSAPDRPAPAASVVVDERQAEVGELRLVARREQDVPRFDVAVDHPPEVCIIEGLCHLSADPQPIAQEQVCANDPRSSARPPPP